MTALLVAASLPAPMAAFPALSASLPTPTAPPPIATPPFLTPPSPQDASFAEGNRLYQAGDFAGAVAQYDSVLRGGFESSELFYNLGNAHYRTGDVARAVLNYERAARLDPAAEDIRANLEIVRRTLRDRIEPLPRFWLLTAVDWWMTLIPGGWLLIGAAACYLAMGAAVVAVVLLRGRGRLPAGLRATLHLGALGTVLLGGTLIARETGALEAERAIVMATETRVLSAPSEEGGLTVFTLHAGTAVRIDRRAGEWAEIVLADGKVGWLRLEVVEVI